jgi:hypothetical protein
MKNTFFAIISIFVIAISLETEAGIFENGDFEQPIVKCNPNEPWIIQDAQVGPGIYNGLVSRKYNSATDNYYLEIESHNSALRDWESEKNRGRL